MNSPSYRERLQLPKMDGYNRRGEGEPFASLKIIKKSFRIHMISRHLSIVHNIPDLPEIRFQGTSHSVRTLPHLHK